MAEVTGMTPDKIIQEVGRQITDEKWQRPPLAANTDMDSVTTPGSHPVVSYSAANSMVNRPDDPGAVNPATVEVQRVSPKLLHQTWTTISAPGQPTAEFVRHHAGGEWSEWLRTDLNTAIKAAYPRIGQVAGADVHDFPLGEHFVTTHGNAMNIKNAPTDYRPAQGGATISVQGHPNYKNILWTTFSGRMLLKTYTHTSGWSEWRPISTVGDLANPTLARVDEDANAIAQTAAMHVPGDAATDPRRWRAKAGKQLITPTHEGSGQATHPGVVHIPEGLSGYTYWMVMTPYPWSQDAHEDPNILASNDGDNWEVPPGLTNPLDDLTGGPGNFNADTDIYWDGEKLTIVWSRPANPGSGDGIQRLACRTSTDGINWTTLRDWFRTDAPNTPRPMVSPSIQRHQGEWWMYGIDVQADDRKIMLFRTSSENPGPTDWVQTNCTITPGLGSGRELWHFDTLFHDGRWWAAVNDTALGTGIDGRVLLFVSEDGIAWRNSTIPLIPQFGDNHDVHYRPTLTASGSVAENNLKFDIWYGARSSEGPNWHIFRTQTLLPLQKINYGLETEAGTRLVVGETRPDMIPDIDTYWVSSAGVEYHGAGQAGTLPVTRFGVGSPEGKVAAPVGSIYTDTAATTGAIRWIKSSGAGGTGWKIQWGDTGWRTIAPTPEGTIRSGTGKILVKRENQRVIWRFGDLGITDGVGAAIIISSSEFPSGFSPYLSGPVFHMSHRTGSTFISKLKIVSSLYWIGLDSGTNLSQTRTNVELRGEISYTTDDPWPATLPGTPA